MVMNVFLLAPILGGMSEIVSSKISEAERTCEKVRTVKLSRARCRKLGEQRFKRKIYFYTGQNQNART